MTYPQEILARAMNHIDDDMILSAHGKRKKVRRVIPVLVAACLIAVLAVSFPYLREVIDTNSDLLGPADGDQGEPGVVSPKPEDTNYIEQDITTSLGGATFTLTHTTETTATFTMVKAFDVPFYAMFYDINHVLLMGRVTSGKGGDLVLAKAMEVLKAEYPELKMQVNLPDEKSRRVGQSVAAASLPQL